MNIKFLMIFAAILTSLILACGTVLGEDPLLELKVANQKYLGKRLIHDYEKVVLMLRDGEIKVIPLSTISGFRKTGEIFKPYGPLQMRTELEREFIKEYEVKSNNEFIVVAPDGYADKYLTICNDVQRSFYHYFVSRGFKLRELEFPLAVIILKDQQAFFNYGKSRDIKEIKLLSGLYHPSTNRIVMHQEGKEAKLSQSFRPVSILAESPNAHEQALIPFSRVPSDVPEIQQCFGGIGNSKSVEETLCHEVTHQLAFNSNLHSRTSEYPRWVIEGLAMTFESPGNRSNTKFGSTMDRVNLERYLHFKSNVAKSRPSQFLEKFLLSEDHFKDHNKILAAYSESWALTFYLIETRPADYGKYLQLLLSRPSYSFYKSVDRLQDFKSIFGNNINIFELQYLQYYNKLY